MNRRINVRLSISSSRIRWQTVTTPLPGVVQPSYHAAVASDRWLFQETPHYEKRCV